MKNSPDSVLYNPWRLRFACIFIVVFLLSQDLVAQTLHWVAGSSCPKGVIYGYRTTIAVDKSGNVYSGGSFNSSLIPHDSVKCYFGPDSLVTSGMLLVSTDSNGAYRWAVGGGRTGGAEIYYIATDSFDHVYIFGNFGYDFILESDTITASPWSGSFCAKFTSTGHLLWMKKIADSSYGFGNVDAWGNVLVAGTFSFPHVTIGGSTLTNSDPSGTTSDIFIVKMDSAGTVLWVKNFGGGATEEVSGICANSSGDIVVTGSYKSSSMSIGTTTLTHPTGITYPYLYLAKYSATGSPQWAKSITANAEPGVRGIALDAWDNIYITGAHWDSIVFESHVLQGSPQNKLYLAKYDNSGNNVWAVRGGNSMHADFGYSVAADGGGNVWISGDGGFVGGGGGLFIYKYNSSGAYTDSIFITIPGTMGADQSNNITVDNNGSVYIAANYPYAGCYLGGDTLVSHDSTIISQFIAKYGYSYTAIPLDAPGSRQVDVAKISLFPNPATDQCSIVINGSTNIATKAVVYDPAGRLLQTYRFAGGRSTMNTSELQPGLYICRVYTDDDSFYTVKLIIEH